MEAYQYTEHLSIFKEKILSLSTSELKFHLYLLWLGLHNANTSYTRNILEKAIHFTDSYDIFTNNENPLQFLKNLDAVKNDLRNLIYISETKSYETMIEEQILNITGLFAGIIFGIIAGIVGGFAGFTRSVWSQENSLKYSLIGVFTGFCLGATVGNRSPHLLMDPVFRQLKFALDGLSTSFTRALQSADRRLHAYQEQALLLLLNEYCDNDEKNLHSLLNAKNISYEIATHPAQFISETLGGYLGHHAFIRIPIGNKYLPLEFTPAPTDVTIPPVQSEIRTVSGKKILELITFHLSLQNTDRCNIYYIASTLKPGITDCLSYINKLLLGTSQEPTKITRFHSSDTHIGFYVVGSCIEGLSPNPSVLCLDSTHDSFR